MTHTPTFYTADRREWRAWLSEHFETEQEVWFVFPTKASGEAALSYNDAVEEALCFGWIDSTAGTLDEAHGVRRFTPRKDFSYYSRPNIERLIWLEARGMLHPTVREDVLGLIPRPTSSRRTFWTRSAATPRRGRTISASRSRTSASASPTLTRRAPARRNFKSGSTTSSPKRGKIN